MAVEVLGVAGRHGDQGSLALGAGELSHLEDRLSNPSSDLLDLNGLQVDLLSLPESLDQLEVSAGREVHLVGGVASELVDALVGLDVLQHVGGLLAVHTGEHGGGLALAVVEFGHDHTSHVVVLAVAGLGKADLLNGVLVLDVSKDLGAGDGRVVVAQINLLDLPGVVVSNLLGDNLGFALGIDTLNPAFPNAVAGASGNRLVVRATLPDVLSVASALEALLVLDELLSSDKVQQVDVLLDLAQSVDVVRFGVELLLDILDEVQLVVVEGRLSVDFLSFLHRFLQLSSARHLSAGVSTETNLGHFCFGCFECFN